MSCNGAVNKPFPNKKETVFSAWSSQSGYKKGSIQLSESSRVGFRDVSLPGYELRSRGIELGCQLQNNGKKGIRL
jgi:hypothetical protein